jgi:hypothetical protein
LASHTWVNRDSLSSLAAANGLASWERIWNDPANSALRELRGSPENIREGDIIEIPAKQLGEVSRPTEVRHPFVRIGVPPASIKIITDGGNPRIAVSTERRVLEVSTFVTTSRLPTGFLTASTDVRNFKVEVFDEGATGQTINCEIEAQKPILDARNRPQRDADGNLTFENFAPRRQITPLQLRRVPGLNHIYRSRYLRLVTDEADDAARANQTLLTDHDPNNLHIEILDQQVVARYTAVSGEPLATEAVVGESEKRVRCVAFVCKTAFGAAGLVGGVTVDDVKRHFRCWVKRTYAAANMSPLLVDNEVVAVDPVENMVAISQFNSANNARGGREIRFRVNTATNPTMITITTVAGETPRQIADRLAAAARVALPTGFTVEIFDNPLAFNRISIVDIIIKNGANQVIIDQERSRDGRIRIVVGRTRVNSTNVAPFNLFNIGLAENRVLIRNHRTNERALAVFVINRFSAAAGAVGFAYTKQFRERGEFQGVFPVAGSCFVEARTTSRADRRVHTTDHEMGHILIDMIHFAGRGTELMTDAAVQLVNNVFDSKRLSDRIIPYRELVNGRNRSFPINPNSEIRIREARFIEGWDDLLRRP